MKKFYTTLGFVLALSLAYTQNTIELQRTLEWEEAPRVHQPTPNISKEYLYFTDASYQYSKTKLPFYKTVFPLSGNAALRVSLVNTFYESIIIKDKEDQALIKRDISFETRVNQDRNAFLGEVSFIPIRKKADGSFEKLVSFELQINPSPLPIPAQTRGDNTFNSVLNDENIYKVGITENGIHKMDYNFLKNELEANIDGAAIDDIKIYGNGGGMLPNEISTERIDDLQELAIEIVDANTNNQFDNGDYILFYAEESGNWEYNASSKLWNYQINAFDTNNYYFLKIGSGASKRVQPQSSLSNTSYSSEGFNDFLHFEEEKNNVLSRRFNANTQGTGKQWLGDKFEALREKDYNSQFNFPNIITSEPATVIASFAGRSNSRSRFRIIADGQQFTSDEIRSTNVTDFESTFAFVKTLSEAFNPSGDNINIKLEYPQVSQASEGYLDYITVNARRKLIMSGQQMQFRDVNTLDSPSSTFSLSNTNSNTSVWDITDPLTPKTQEANTTAGSLSFGVTSTELKTFVAFDRSGSFPTPTAIGAIKPQNVHGIDEVDMIIIYPEVFESAAQQLATHRESQSQLIVRIVEIGQIFNEFSSGRVDPSAIRDFAKMLYDRNDQFRYLLLMGDGSFDYRNIYGENELNDNNQNLIPVYETNNSMSPINGYPSDDYYALLSDDEGGDQLLGAMDIAIGRLPVRNLAEAQIAVNKIINYDTNPNTLGDWRNRITFVADDEDTNRHISDADKIAQDITANYQNFNVDKIYFDAYQQVSTAGGEKYPAASNAINANMFKGLLVMNYLGHGGWKGWSQERVMGINDIKSWTNGNTLPLFVTATCSFSGYDEPTLTTGGEEVFLNEKGGAVALFSTVRAVFATSNFRLTKEVFETIFEKENNQFRTIGEVLRTSKNGSSASPENSRKFTLLGDPSMKLALPEYNVSTTKINGRVVDGTPTDTIRALQRVTIEGAITDDNGQVISNFNGKVFPTLFDKTVKLFTLGQDEKSRVAGFDLQKSIIFKGTASVTNGKFQFTFVVPKDINFAFGQGKISYYASDESSKDATGSYEAIVIGGTDNNALTDTQGPEIEVYMNDTTFAFGGITNPNPILLVKLRDDNGINVVGNSIGHDLTAVLDESTQNTLQLNDFYESALDDYTKGTVRFPLFDIVPGRHQVRVRAWDVANNNSEAYTEFVVAESAELALDHVLNYPNPFTTNTNFQFEHNFADQLLDIQVSIYTVSGRLVKTIEEQIISSGFRITNVNWDGTDDFGDRLAKGVYLYKVKVGLAQADGLDAEAESEFEKLVILK